MNHEIIATIYESFIWANFEAEPELLTPELLADIKERIQDNLYWFIRGANPQSRRKLK
jgi:hypothetical protein